MWISGSGKLASSPPTNRIHGVKKMRLPTLFPAALAAAGLAALTVAGPAQTVVHQAAPAAIVEERAAGGSLVNDHLRIYTAGVDFSRPVGVVVRLHGDGAYEFHHPEYLLDGLAQTAARHNMILVAPLTPDVADGSTWWRDSAANAQWLAGTLESQVLGAYDVDRSDVWWMGYSGGAELLSRELIPRHPGLVSGGAVMLGGGGAPHGVAPAEWEAARQQVGPLTWLTGAEDDGSDPASGFFDALTASRAGAALYREKGFTVQEHHPEGVGHFGLDHAGILDAALS